MNSPSSSNGGSVVESDIPSRKASPTGPEIVAEEEPVVSSKATPTNTTNQDDACQKNDDADKKTSDIESAVKDDNDKQDVESPASSKDDTAEVIDTPEEPSSDEGTGPEAQESIEDEAGPENDEAKHDNKDEEVLPSSNSDSVEQIETTTESEPEEQGSKANDSDDSGVPPVDTKKEETGPGSNESNEVLPSKKDTLPQEIEEEEDEEIRLAMEMAQAAAQNPHLSPAEIQKLVGEKNEQTKLIAKQKGERWNKKKEQVASWWSAAAKRAEEIKDRAERRLYYEQIKKDPEILEMRKKMKILKKTLKAHRLQGNRVDTRHAFKRQRNEKKLMGTNDKLKRTQRMFTNSSYNVQEYLKAMMRASKKWRKKGTDEELMLEAQLCRNMHQMLALEKQKVKLKKETKEMKKYLQRCKGWLSDKKSFCEMNLITLRTTQNSILNLFEETLRRQDALIAKLKASEEFKDVDLSDVDVSHVDLPPFFKEVESSPLRGLPINDSIRVKKDRDSSSQSQESQQAKQRAKEEAQSRAALVENFYKQQQQQQQQQASAQYANRPEIIVDTTRDEASVSSHLSDPDASGHGELEDSEQNFFGNDAPWMASDPNLDAVEEDDSSDEENDKAERKPAPEPSFEATGASDDDKKPRAKDTPKPPPQHQELTEEKDVQNTMVSEENTIEQGKHEAEKSVETSAQSS